AIFAAVPSTSRFTKRSNSRRRACAAKKQSQPKKASTAMSKKNSAATLSERKYLKVVGKPFRKVDARAKCTGQTLFADDIALPRMLYAKLLRSHVPHALIKRVDVSRALNLPGVIAIITGRDLPIPYGILPVSQDE